MDTMKHNFSALSFFFQKKKKQSPEKSHICLKYHLDVSLVVLFLLLLYVSYYYKYANCVCCPIHSTLTKVYIKLLKFKIIILLNFYYYLKK